MRDTEIWCTGKSKEKNWLLWRQEQPADFILRLEFRWDKGNSGVQVRSDDLGKWQVFGYQAEIASQDKMGLWHHSLLAKDHPRKKVRHLMATAGQVVTLGPDGSRTVKQDWDPKNVMFATVIDHDKEMSRKEGFIALQDHGKGCTVAFRKIRLKKLP